MSTTSNRPVSRWYYFLWHSIAIVLVVLCPVFLSGTPVWQLESSELFLYLLFAAGYLAAAVLCMVHDCRLGPSGFLATMTIALAIFGVIFLWILATRMPYARRILLGLFPVVMVLMVAPFAVRRYPVTGLSILASLALVALFLTMMGKRDVFHLKTVESVSRNVITTALYNTVATEHHGKIPWTNTNGGGLARIGSDILLVTGDGRMFVLRWTNSWQSLSVQRLPHQVPLNADVFVSETDLSIDERRFRVADILVQQSADTMHVFASHHYWKSSEECFVVRVSMISADRAEFLAGRGDQEWSTIFESTPCLGVKESKSGEKEDVPRFAGHQIGGRLALLHPQTLILTVGDHRFDGVNSIQQLSQDHTTSYGKTIRIGLADGSSEIFSSGHRNAQGLFVDRKGNIWLTEHGPQGGDELNIVLPDTNYGWPVVTYGTDYGSFVWPLNKEQGSHDGYEAPVFAWSPAIGVSNLIRIERSLFPLWQEDLVISSLIGQQIIRVRVRNGRVVYAEPIKIGKRIRDLIESEDGTIVLWTDDATIVTIRPADENQMEAAEYGQMLFAACTGCHFVKDGKTHGIGPDLAGVVGRQIGSADGYSYSAALSNLSDGWSEDALDAFLADPESFAPGNLMIFDRISDPSSRAAIISYLKTQK